MARFAEPYTLYKRKMKDGRAVFYYMARDPDTGKRLAGVSTGKLSMREAHKYCEQLLAEGRLIPAPKEPKPPVEIRRSRRPPTLAEWVEERHWWEWGDDGPRCEYCRNELKRSSESAPAVQRDHADRSRRILRKNIVPLHGAKRIDQIEPADLENIMASWADEASAKTVNNRASVYRVMLKEAKRLKVIRENPWDSVKAYYVQDNPKGTLTRAEYVRLMAPDGFENVWGGNFIYYSANLLSSVTGLRQGEVLALKADQIHGDHITVAHSYQRKYGEGPQKTKRGTDQIPIPRMVYDLIAPLLAWGGYVFSFSNGERPCSGNRCNDALKAALEKIGIDDKKRRERNISFHSWRAFANTYFRSAGVPDAKVRDITRHESEAMTEHYTGFNLEDFREVAEAQESLAALLQPPGTPGMNRGEPLRTSPTV